MIGKMASIIQNFIRNPNDAQIDSEKSQGTQGNTKTEESINSLSDFVFEAKRADAPTNKGFEESGRNAVGLNSKAKNYETVEKDEEDPRKALTVAELDYFVQKFAAEVGKKINVMRLDLGKVVNRLESKHKVLEAKLEKALEKLSTIKVSQLSDSMVAHQENHEGSLSETQELNGLIAIDYVRPNQWIWVNQFNSNIEHLHIVDYTIAAKSAAAVFGAKNLSEKQGFKVFVKKGHEVSIGVALQKFRSQGHRVHKVIGHRFGHHFSDNLCIELSNHGVCWDGATHLKLSRGFEDGDVISVEADLQDCTLTWLVNDQVLHSVRNQALGSKTWVPYISLSKKDSIRIVSH